MATDGSPEYWQLVMQQYYLSWGVRGDNTPEYAKYLGYLDARELYPDFKPITMEEYIKEVLDGNATAVFRHLRK